MKEGGMPGGSSLKPLFFRSKKPGFYLDCKKGQHSATGGMAPPGGKNLQLQ